MLSSKGCFIYYPDAPWTAPAQVLQDVKSNGSAHVFNCISDKRKYRSREHQQHNQKQLDILVMLIMQKKRYEWDESIACAIATTTVSPTAGCKMRTVRGSCRQAYLPGLTIASPEVFIEASIDITKDTT